MNWSYATAAAGGMVLGILFFGGLLVTVGKGLSSQQPWVWFLLSMLVRSGVTIAGFLLIAGTDPAKLLWCAGGFTAARMLFVGLGRLRSRTHEKEASCI